MDFLRCAFKSCVKLLAKHGKQHLSTLVNLAKITGKLQIGQSFQNIWAVKQFVQSSQNKCTAEQIGQSCQNMWTAKQMGQN